MKNLRIVLSIAVAAAFPAMTTMAENPKLTDPEIASVAVVANQIDISYAEVAKQKTKNKEVLNFAQTMANDHAAVIAQASALVKKLNVTPKDNAVSTSLLSGSEKTIKSLKEKSGDDFNKAYIDNEVEYHKAVISTVENVLIPQTQNKELKELLQNVLPALKMHLEHAEMVQKSFSKK
jgi:putative membrane protein